mgnify:CR=1 FL=1|jgi:hypothetical protein
MDDLHARIPVNSVAGRVIGTGTHFDPNKRVQNNDSETPIATRPFTRAEQFADGFLDLTGRRFGRFKVLGFARDFKRQWVVRCDCGRYSTRSAKAVKNQANTQDRCEHCRHLAFLKRDERWRNTGREADICDF